MVGRAKTALTQKAVDAARATGKPYTLGDAACPGLRLWVGKTGTKRWQRQEGSQTIILGDAAVISLTQARATGDRADQGSAAEASAPSARWSIATSRPMPPIWRRIRGGPGSSDCSSLACSTGRCRR